MHHAITRTWDVRGEKVLTRSCSCGERWEDGKERCPAEQLGAAFAPPVDEVQPRASQLTYWAGRELHPLLLSELARMWSELLDSGMPGSKIKAIKYDGSDSTLVVTFE